MFRTQAMQIDQRLSDPIPVNAFIVEFTEFSEEFHEK